jgi:dihydrofolate reductase
MPRLIYISNVSLDGYINDRAGAFDFAVPSREVFGAILECLRPVGTHLYGRRTYETMAPWETAHVVPDAPAFVPGNGDLEREFATVWRAAEKIVVSTTLQQGVTARTRIVNALEQAAIRQLKHTSDRDLMVGGAHLAGAMLAADLVDELFVHVYPVILGGGTSWLPSEVRVSLELVGERRIGGVVQMHYRIEPAAR